MKDFLLAPSLLSADLTQLKNAVDLIETQGGSWVHIDVMDGAFVPNISYGQPVVESLRKVTKLPFDVHLMINNPENHIETFAQAGADYITFHYENVIHHHRLIQQIKEQGKKAGISIVPSTPVDALKEILPFVDLVLVMTVNPGFGGQTLIPECLNKIEQLVTLRTEKSYSYQISVDGGINSKTLPMAVAAGADVVVSGSSFFSGQLKW
ncbi:MAG: ribulose-phosphate 3-epimerase [Spirochaetaceae bacterium]|nr:ribulose-phosphate 3-epimerase [Spirochaetaceae bacterium]